MSILQKDHVLGAGGSAVLGGAVVGGLGFAVGGPPGLVIGVVAGTAAGALIGHRASEAADHRGNIGHFEQIYRQTRYYVADMEWRDYEPAYRLGLDSYRTHGGQPLEDVEAALGARWLNQRGESRLNWEQARDAVAHVWREMDQGLREKGRH
ncbi:hypothetical protein H0E84_07295 [Luteimonas sp. SJ-92]|uniref:Glycine zipper domain-containing protein n=1 Tax=Luteimonas salinisoli TaxID=2752307 RepID=A0A853JC40_9GAMM|nr:hypothetical protein [Luteimonas salinisoli]NZA26188.1 hypothetical protein [Luteimonas salinisoli]